MNIPLLRALLLAALSSLWAASPAVANDWIYHVQKGDTLWNLCLEYTNKRGCWIELRRYNKIPNDKKIPLGTAIRIPTSWLRSPPVVGNVLGVRGAVSYLQFGAARSTPLAVGEPVHLGGVISTGDGSARILLLPDNILLLRADSILELTTFGRPGRQNISSEVSLDRGSVEATVVPGRGTHFQIETPAAIAAVRGTHYRVVNIDGETESMRAEVLSGSVAVGTENPQLVASGFGVIATKGVAPGKPKKLLPPPRVTRNHINMPAPAVLEWVESGRESGWQLDLQTSGKGASIVRTVRTSAPHFQFDELANGCYTVVLRAIDKEGFNGLESSSSLCIVPSLPAVGGVTAEGSGENWTVQWAGVEGAQRYRVELASDASFDNIISSKEVSGLEVALPKPVDNGFSTRVIALDQHGNAGPASETLDYAEDSHWEPWAFLAILLILIL